MSGSSAPTLEGNVVDNADSVGIVGSIRLSPEVRFTVEAERSSYWRVGAYDRFTGGSWVRTGDTRRYDGELASPPGVTTTVEQTITAETTLNSMPAMWKPVSVGGNVQQATQVTAEGGLRAAAPIAEGESYTVVSERPAYTTRALRNAGTDYPDAIRNRYLGLPDSTPDRVGERAAAVADRANASTPYATAVAIEEYLESDKEYSLNVERPRGNVADAFLFEMNAGYCTYYATTMAVMLRTQGIPARMATGYTTGERVTEDEWVVRGLNAHAWVEVYFPEVGWVAFDPTPSSPREETGEQRLSQAREAGEAGVDTNQSGPGEWTPTPTATPAGSQGRTTRSAQRRRPIWRRSPAGSGPPAPASSGASPPAGAAGRAGCRCQRRKRWATGSCSCSARSRPDGGSASTTGSTGSSGCATSPARARSRTWSGRTTAWRRY
ncbi:transglutaminase-like superfamily protein [Halolamina pelagica]|uniref:Transglutaminase-like superfamily protein n=1 Tax=Halolamina pelagica TaxID=699431 RepID=A0A0P7GCR5_9EURY|nr:DUF3488 and transglutaminase-like domain-containing protein [Halolamina pelagica]KPN31799.1 transglutaminase-like superfamily protein [Halolamina pelagica]